MEFNIVISKKIFQARVCLGCWGEAQWEMELAIAILKNRRARLADLFPWFKSTVIPEQFVELHGQERADQVEAFIFTGDKGE